MIQFKHIKIEPKENRDINFINKNLKKVPQKSVKFL